MLINDGLFVNDVFSIVSIGFELYIAYFVLTLNSYVPEGKRTHIFQNCLNLLDGGESMKR